MSFESRIEGHNINEISVASDQVCETSKADLSASALCASLSLHRNSHLNAGHQEDGKSRPHFHLPFHTAFIALSVIQRLKYWVFDLPRAQ